LLLIAGPNWPRNDLRWKSSGTRFSGQIPAAIMKEFPLEIKRKGLKAIVRKVSLENKVTSVDGSILT